MGQPPASRLQIGYADRLAVGPGQLGGIQAVCLRTRVFPRQALLDAVDERAVAADFAPTLGRRRAGPAAGFVMQEKVGDAGCHAILPGVDVVEPVKSPPMLRKFRILTIATWIFLSIDVSLVTTRWAIHSEAPSLSQLGSDSADL